MLLIAFEKFCKLKGLQINVKKTKAMQINMDVNFYSNNIEIENVSEFKYLGLVIDRSNNNPSTMLDKRL